LVNVFLFFRQFAESWGNCIGMNFDQRIWRKPESCSHVKA